MNRTVSLALICLIFLPAIHGYPSYSKLKSVFSWKALEFAFPSDVVRENAIRDGSFVPGAPVPIDVDIYLAGKRGSIVFVSIPRFQDGVPVTLGYVTDQVSTEGNPIIAPYPSWDWQRIGNCDGITSVYRIQVDSCNRLWVLDTGKIGENQICPPQLHVFSLQSNRIIGQYKFPKDQYKDDSLFVTPVVDVRNNECRDSFVYIADVTGFTMLVYDQRNNRSWKIINNLFYPYPPHGTFHIKGDSFDLMDGIIGMALGPVRPDGDRLLYFHSLASTVESYVPTSVIRNASLFEGNAEAEARSFKAFKNERSSQSAAEAMDRNGVLFFGLMSDLAIGCWNSKNYPEYGGKNIEIAVSNPDTLQFPSGLKIITEKSGKQELWVLTASFQRYMSGSLHSNETNFRVQAGFVDELVRGTKCDVSALAIKDTSTLKFPQ
ncbi:dopaminechrome tautomerase-like [Prorops nasuta]|uniref:dopaminechrome tautomerase-like n=1 Tax=Prorops nasuta TaxID=863751 RepID=UPI0034CD8E74